MIAALALCHNVTPYYKETVDGKEKDLIASSPDEIALVKFSDSLGYDLKEREATVIRLTNPGGKLEEYEILANFPFSSETKRMGIVVRNTSTNYLTLYVKGAEEVMTNKVKGN